MATCVVSSKSDSELDFMKKDKKVRFADSLGLSLVSVCVIPEREQDSFKNRCRRRTQEEKIEEARILNFSQPLTCPDFPQRVDRLNVCLENIAFKNCAIVGVVKVRNLAYDKHVFVRYTMDNWNSFKDVPAKYVCGSSNGWTDSFSFEITLRETLEKDCRLEMAFGYEVLGARFWDNNHGDNYRVKCFSTARLKDTDFWRTFDIYRTSRYIGDVGVWFWLSYFKLNVIACTSCTSLFNGWRFIHKLSAIMHIILVSHQSPGFYKFGYIPLL